MEVVMDEKINDFSDDEEILNIIEDFCKEVLPEEN